MGTGQRESWREQRPTARSLIARCRLHNGPRSIQYAVFDAGRKRDAFARARAHVHTRASGTNTRIYGVSRFLLPYQPLMVESSMRARGRSFRKEQLTVCCILYQSFVKNLKNESLIKIE